MGCEVNKAWLLTVTQQHVFQSFTILERDSGRARQPCAVKRIKKTEKMSIGRAQTTSHKKKKSMSESQL